MGKRGVILGNDMVGMWGGVGMEIFVYFGRGINVEDFIPSIQGRVGLKT